MYINQLILLPKFCSAFCNASRKSTADLKEKNSVLCIWQCLSFTIPMRTGKKTNFVFPIFRKL